MSGPRSKSLAGAIRANRMSTRPEFTSGRGAKLGDLPPRVLFVIWDLLSKGECAEPDPENADQFPRGAAEAFVDLVEFTKVMSATAFLIGLYQLERDGWVFTKPSAQHVGISLDGSEGQAFATMASAMFGGGRDETAAIKNNFLSHHGREISGHVYRGRRGPLGSWGT